MGGFFLVKKKRSKAYFCSFLPLNPTIELKPTAIKPNTVEGSGTVVIIVPCPLGNPGLPF